MRVATQWGWCMSLLRVSFRRSLLVLAAAVLLLTFSFSSSSDTANAGPSIDVGDVWFCDAFQGLVCETTVPAGSLVTWNWVGFLPHNAVECGTNWNKGPLCTGGGGPDWASATQTSGSFARLFDTEGEFFYLCTVHSTLMRGKIIVSGQAVGGIAELPGLSSTSQLTADTGGDRSVLIAAIIAATLVSMAVVGSSWLMTRKLLGRS